MTFVTDRVRLHHAGVTQLSGPYDLVLVLEALHDMTDPSAAPADARAALARRATVLIADEKVADGFTAPGDEVERMMYGWSVTHCPPTQMVGHRRPLSARCCAPAPSAASRPRPASRASTCSPSRTTSSAFARLS